MESRLFFLGLFHVYILECVDASGKKTLYTGSTNDMSRRLEEHASGKGAKYTRGKKIKLVHLESMSSRGEAMRREIAIKKMSKAQKLALIKGLGIK